LWYKICKNENHFIEILHKYIAGQTDEIASQAAFKPVAHFFDKNK